MLRMALILLYLKKYNIFSHMWSLLKQLRVDRVLMEDNPNLSLTLIVPSNAAWEKAQRSFSKAYNTLVDGQFPQYVSSKNRFIHSVLVNLL